MDLRARLGLCAVRSADDLPGRVRRDQRPGRIGRATKKPETLGWGRPPDRLNRGLVKTTILTNDSWGRVRHKNGRLDHGN